MHYLGLGLIAEGTTDHDFLGPLLRRTVEDVCLRAAMHPVEVSDVLRLPVSPEGDGYFQGAAKVAEQASAACNLIFLHRDSGGRAQQTNSDFIDRLFEEVAAAAPGSTQVRVVPVQETEAWALADGDALRSAFRTNLSDSALGLPQRPAQVERITGPKEVLEEAYGRTVSPRRRKREASSFLEVIALTLQIELLRQVPAFQTFEHDLVVALTEMGYLRSGS